MPNILQPPIAHPGVSDAFERGSWVISFFLLPMVFLSSFRAEIRSLYEHCGFLLVSTDVEDLQSLP
jgi:hypothetical protein